jgi:hypothetical protein
MRPTERSSISYNAALVLQALGRGFGYGFDVMRTTELPSGTVYPLLRRLEDAGLVRSRWGRGPWQPQPRTGNVRRPSSSPQPASTATIPAAGARGSSRRACPTARPSCSSARTCRRR